MVLLVPSLIYFFCYPKTCSITSAIYSSNSHKQRTSLPPSEFRAHWFLRPSPYEGNSPYEVNEQATRLYHHKPQTQAVSTWVATIATASALYPSLFCFWSKLTSSLSSSDLPPHPRPQKVKHKKRSLCAWSIFTASGGQTRLISRRSLKRRGMKLGFFSSTPSWVCGLGVSLDLCPVKDKNISWTGPVES